MRRAGRQPAVSGAVVSHRGDGTLQHGDVFPDLPDGYGRSVLGYYSGFFEAPESALFRFGVDYKSRERMMWDYFARVPCGQCYSNAALCALKLAPKVGVPSLHQVDRRELCLNQHQLQLLLVSTAPLLASSAVLQTLLLPPLLV